MHRFLPSWRFVLAALLGILAGYGAMQLAQTHQRIGQYPQVAVSDENRYFNEHELTAELKQTVWKRSARILVHVGEAKQQCSGIASECLGDIPTFISDAIADDAVVIWIDPQNYYADIQSGYEKDGFNYSYATEDGLEDALAAKLIVNELAPSDVAQAAQMLADNEAGVYQVPKALIWILGIVTALLVMACAWLGLDALYQWQWARSQGGEVAKLPKVQRKHLVAQVRNIYTDAGMALEDVEFAALMHESTLAESVKKWQQEYVSLARALLHVRRDEDLYHVRAAPILAELYRSARIVQSGLETLRSGEPLSIERDSYESTVGIGEIQEEERRKKYREKRRSQGKGRHLNPHSPRFQAAQPVYVRISPALVMISAGLAIVAGVIAAVITAPRVDHLSDGEQVRPFCLPFLCSDADMSAVYGAESVVSGIIVGLIAFPVLLIVLMIATYPARRRRQYQRWEEEVRTALRTVTLGRDALQLEILYLQSCYSVYDVAERWALWDANYAAIVRRIEDSESWAEKVALARILVSSTESLWRIQELISGDKQAWEDELTLCAQYDRYAHTRFRIVLNDYAAGRISAEETLVEFDKKNSSLLAIVRSLALLEDTHTITPARFEPATFSFDATMVSYAKRFARIVGIFARKGGVVVLILFSIPVGFYAIMNTATQPYEDRPAVESVSADRMRTVAISDEAHILDDDRLEEFISEYEWGVSASLAVITAERCEPDFMQSPDFSLPDEALAVSLFAEHRDADYRWIALCIDTESIKFNSGSAYMQMDNYEDSPVFVAKYEQSTGDPTDRLMSSLEADSTPMVARVHVLTDLVDDFHLNRYVKTADDNN